MSYILALKILGLSENYTEEELNDAYESKLKECYSKSVPINLIENAKNYLLNRLEENKNLKDSKEDLFAQIEDYKLKKSNEFRVEYSNTILRIPDAALYNKIVNCYIDTLDKIKESETKEEVDELISSYDKKNKNLILDYYIKLFKDRNLELNVDSKLWYSFWNEKKYICNEVSCLSELYQKFINMLKECYFYINSTIFSNKLKSLLKNKPLIKNEDKLIDREILDNKSLFEDKIIKNMDFYVSKSFDSIRSTYYKDTGKKDLDLIKFYTLCRINKIEIPNKVLKEIKGCITSSDLVIVLREYLSDLYDNLEHKYYDLIFRIKEFNNINDFFILYKDINECSSCILISPTIEGIIKSLTDKLNKNETNKNRILYQEIIEFLQDVDKNKFVSVSALRSINNVTFENYASDVKIISNIRVMIGKGIIYSKGQANEKR